MYPPDQAHPRFFLPDKYGALKQPDESVRAAERWQARYSEPIDWHMREQLAYALRNRLEPYERELVELAKYSNALWRYFVQPWADLLTTVLSRGRDNATNA